MPFTNHYDFTRLSREEKSLWKEIHDMEAKQPAPVTAPDPWDPTQKEIAA